jgi:hypothetical protein
MDTDLKKYSKYFENREMLKELLNSKFIEKIYDRIIVVRMIEQGVMQLPENFDHKIVRLIKGIPLHDGDTFYKTQKEVNRYLQNEKEQSDEKNSYYIEMLRSYVTRQQIPLMVTLLEETSVLNRAMWSLTFSKQILIDGNESDTQTIKYLLEKVTAWDYELKKSRQDYIDDLEKISKKLVTTRNEIYALNDQIRQIKERKKVASVFEKPPTPEEYNTASPLLKRGVSEENLPHIKRLETRYPHHTDGYRILQSCRLSSGSFSEQ